MSCYVNQTIISNISKYIMKRTIKMICIYINAIPVTAYEYALTTSPACINIIFIITGQILFKIHYDNIMITKYIMITLIAI